MTFLNPLVLLGLLAAAIPILIHIFNFRRPQKIEFSSLKFLKDLEKTAVQRVRIQQWLLLALRILAVVSLVLGFAQPIWENLSAKQGAYAKTQSVLVLDNSLSMTLRDGQGAYWQQVKHLATEVLQQAPKGDEFRILQTSGSTKGEHIFYNTASAIEELKKIEPKPDAGSLFKSIRRAVAQLSDVNQRNKAIFLFSDLQKSTFADSLKTQIPKDIQVYLIPVGTQSTPKNVSIQKVDVFGGMPEVGKPIKVQATLFNHSKENIGAYVVSIYLGGERAGEQALNLKPESATVVDFEVVPKQKGWIAGEVRSSEDAFPYDNKRYFTVHIPDQFKLLHVNGNGIDGSFTELALSAEVAEGTPPFQTTNMSEGGFGGTTFSNYDAVLLNGVQNISGGTAQNLKNYLENGGGVLLSLRSADGVGAFLKSIGGGNPNGKVGEAGSGKTVAQFSNTNEQHPIFEGMFDGLTGSRGIESPAFQSFVRYQSGNQGEQNLIKLSSGTPYLQEIRYGKGKLLLATSPFDPTYSDLPLRGLFIPLLYRSLFYLASGNASAEYALDSGKSTEVQLVGTNGNPVRLKNVTGAEVVPPQRAINGAIWIQLDNSIPRAGIYEVFQDNQLLRRIAVNMNDAESNLAQITPKAAQNQLASRTTQNPTLIQPKQNASKQKISQTLSALRIGTELWQWMLVAALLFLLTEMGVTAWQKKAKS